MIDELRDKLNAASERIAELEKELIKARLDLGNEKGLSAKFERDAKHWTRNYYKADAEAADWHLIAGELAVALKPYALDLDICARERKALAAFYAMGKGDGK